MKMQRDLFFRIVTFVHTHQLSPTPPLYMCVSVTDALFKPTVSSKRYLYIVYNALHVPARHRSTDTGTAWQARYGHRLTDPGAVSQLALATEPLPENASDSHHLTPPTAGSFRHLGLAPDCVGGGNATDPRTGADRCIDRPRLVTQPWRKCRRLAGWQADSPARFLGVCCVYVQCSSRLNNPLGRGGPSRLSAWHRLRVLGKVTTV